jgi:hypothetical protein
MKMKMKRRDFCKTAAGVTVGVGALAGPVLAPVNAQVIGHAGRQVAEIYELQAAFHRAKTTQDIDLMMSLWDINGILNIQGDPNSPYVGFDQLKAFWLRSGSFTHLRFSLTPPYKIRIEVERQQAQLYFECIDIGDFDQPGRFIAAVLFLAGTLSKVEDKWVFFDMTGGSASPLSVDHYYFP